MPIFATKAAFSYIFNVLQDLHLYPYIIPAPGLNKEGLSGTRALAVFDAERASSKSQGRSKNVHCQTCRKSKHEKQRPFKCQGGRDTSEESSSLHRVGLPAETSSSMKEETTPLPG